MRTLNLFLLFFFLFALNSYSLPECEGDDFAKWNNCSGTVSLDDSKWEAEFRNGLPNGKGTTTYVNGNKYVGKLKDGNFHGKGTFTFANGNKYVGGWKDGKKHGKGTDHDKETGFRSDYEFQDGELIEFLRVY